MTVTSITGAQWGDEGKGKITHLLASDYDAVIRYQGGSNAGHTVEVADDTFRFHLLPSGILHEGKTCILANGVVITPGVLAEEIEELSERGALRGDLVVSSGSHLVMPYHRMLDNLQEELRGDDSIGTTGHGIGPTYSDKYARTGLKAAHLLEPSVFRDRLEFALKRVNHLLTELYNEDPLDTDGLYDRVMSEAESFRDKIEPVVPLVRDLLDAEANILLEGAQGTLLDIDYGTYPFVTSSHPVSGGGTLGTGIAPNRIDRIVGVSKIYATRVGNGSFPTELENDVGEAMRQAGDEFGTTTGRPRRCGWLDLVLLKYAVLINGCTELALTKLDVLDDFETIKICTGYRMNDGELIEDVDLDDTILSECEPVYLEFPGWQTDTTGITDPGKLPSEMLELINFVEQKVDVPVSLLSVGPRHEQSIFLEN